MGLLNFLSPKVDTGSEWGRLIYPDIPPGTMIPKNKVEADTRMQVSFRLKTIQDCVKLVNETATPAVFFERYEKMIQNMEWMAQIEKYYPFRHPFPSEQLDEIKGKRVQTINDFIDRYYDKLVKQIIKLKTEKGRLKKVDDWLHELTLYSDKMEDENVQKYTEMWARFQPETYR